MKKETLTFITKEEYFAWRADWRRKYADIAAKLKAGDFSVNSDMATYMLEIRTESKVRAGLLRDGAEATPFAIKVGIKTILQKREEKRVKSMAIAKANASAYKEAMKAYYAARRAA